MGHAKPQFRRRLGRDRRRFDYTKRRHASFVKEKNDPVCSFYHVVYEPLIGNLRTTTKFTTTTSVDWERTGPRTSVSAGKRKLKMQSIGRSTTTTLNVYQHVEVVQL